MEDWHAQAPSRADTVVRILTVNDPVMSALTFVLPG